MFLSFFFSWLGRRTLCFLCFYVFQCCCIYFPLRSLCVFCVFVFFNDSGIIEVLMSFCVFVFCFSWLNRRTLCFLCFCVFLCCCVYCPLRSLCIFCVFVFFNNISVQVFLCFFVLFFKTKQKNSVFFSSSLIIFF